MRILFLVSKLSGGGAERQNGLLAAALRRRGHEVLVGHAGAGPGLWPPEAPTHPFRVRHPWNPLLIVDTIRLIRAWKPDLVQTSLPLMDVVGGLAAVATGVPWVVRESTVGAAHGAGVRTRLRLTVARLGARGVIANSAEGASYWSRVAPAVPRHVVPNGFEAEPSPSSGKRERRVLYAGRLVREKNVDIVLRAAALVENLEVDICGEGALRGELETLARTLGISHRVHFHGFVDALSSYRARASFGILLGDWEGHPNVVGEAFAARLPMILSESTTEFGTAGEDDALFTPARDVAQVAAAMRECLDDPLAANARATRAARRVSEWTVDAMAAAYERVFSSLAGST